MFCVLLKTNKKTDGYKLILKKSAGTKIILACLLFCNF